MLCVEDTTWKIRGRRYVEDTWREVGCLRDPERCLLFSGAGPVARAAHGGRKGAGSCPPRGEGRARGAAGRLPPPAWAALQLRLHPEDQGQSSVGFPGNPGGNFISAVDVFIS